MKKEKVSVVDKMSFFGCRKCESLTKLTWEKQRSKQVYFLCDDVVSPTMLGKDIEKLEKCPNMKVSNVQNAQKA